MYKIHFFFSFLKVQCIESQLDAPDEKVWAHFTCSIPNLLCKTRNMLCFLECLVHILYIVQLRYCVAYSILLIYFKVCSLDKYHALYSTLYNLHCTLFIVQCTVYSIVECCPNPTYKPRTSCSYKRKTKDRSCRAELAQQTSSLQHFSIWTFHPCAVKMSKFALWCLQCLV